MVLFFFCKGSAENQHVREWATISSSEHMLIFLRQLLSIMESAMSWHQLSLKVSDVLALLGQRCLGTYQLGIKDYGLGITDYGVGMELGLRITG